MSNFKKRCKIARFVGDQVKCRRCRGTGNSSYEYWLANQEDDCPRCGGRGARPPYYFSLGDAAWGLLEKLDELTSEDLMEILESEDPKHALAECALRIAEEKHESVD